MFEFPSIFSAAFKHLFAGTSQLSFQIWWTRISFSVFLELSSELSPQSYIRIYIFAFNHQFDYHRDSQSIHIYFKKTSSTTDNDILSKNKLLCFFFWFITTVLQLALIHEFEIIPDTFKSFTIFFSKAIYWHNG